MTDVFRFEFVGRVPTLDEEFEFESPSKSSEDGPRENIRQIVRDLNRFHSEEICMEVEADLSRTLPPGVRVSAEITFQEGSIEWVGVITVLDWMARLGSSMGFLEYVGRAIEMSVNRSVGRHMRRGPGFPRRRKMKTDVFQVPGSPGYIGKRSSPTVGSSYRRLEWVLYANSVMLLTLLALKLGEFLG